MKQKIQSTRLIKSVKIVFLSAFVLIQYFGLTVNTSSAQSGCKFNIEGMEAQPGVVTKASDITFYAKVTQTGSGPECQPYVNSEFKFYASVKCANQNDVSCTSDWKELTSVSVAFGQSQTREIAHPYSGLKNFDFTTLANPNVLPYHMVIFSNGSNRADTTSWNKSLTVSGQTTGGGGGVLQANIEVQPGTITPTGPDLKVTVKMDQAQINQLPAKVSMLTYVNGKQVGNNYGSGSQGIDRAYLKEGVYQTMKTSAADVFKNNSNDIRVDIQDASAPFRVYARVTGKVEGQGYAGTTAPPPTPGGGETPTPGGTTPGGAAGPKVDCLATPNSADCLYNPLPTGDLTTMFLLIAKGTLGLVAVWAVIFIIVGGFRMVTSAGNEEAYGVAKKTVTWAILGVVIAVLSFSMVAIVEDLLKADIQNVSGTTGTTPK